ncbi:MAG TPA: hypothetical protein VGJ28_22155 [Micromonosporaceae bacterium]
MGIDYSYVIYVRPEKARDLLLATAAMCRRYADPTTVELPSGESVSLPFTVSWAGGSTVRLEPGTTLALDLVPCFVEDDVLLAYGAEPVIWPDGTSRIPVGYTYLSIGEATGHFAGHLAFEFTPASSEQSRVYLRSPSVRAAYADLAARADAPLCLLDVEAWRYYVIVAVYGRQLADLFWTAGTQTDRSECFAWLENPTYRPDFVVGPEHRDYDGIVAELNRASGLGDDTVAWS